MDYLLHAGVVLLKRSELWQWYRKIGCLKEKLDSLAVGTRETISDQIGCTFPIGEGKLIILECQHPSQQKDRGLSSMDKRKQGLVVSANRNLSTMKVWMKKLERPDDRMYLLLSG